MRNYPDHSKFTGEFELEDGDVFGIGCSFEIVKGNKVTATFGSGSVFKEIHLFESKANFGDDITITSIISSTSSDVVMGDYIEIKDCISSLDPLNEENIARLRTGRHSVIKKLFTSTETIIGNFAELETVLVMSSTFVSVGDNSHVGNLVSTDYGIVFGDNCSCGMDGFITNNHFGDNPIFTAEEIPAFNNCVFRKNVTFDRPIEADACRFKEEVRCEAGAKMKLCHVKEMVAGEECKLDKCEVYSLYMLEPASIHSFESVIHNINSVDYTIRYG